MSMNKILLIALTSIISFNLQSEESQTAWKKETVQGFPVFEGQLEITEGFGAYLDFCLRPNSKNFDNGGGSHDYNTQFLKNYHGVSNYVYDPFQRSEEVNATTLNEIKKHDFDTATSNSVLNVINTHEARIKHISLSCEALKEGGIAYFKIYPGDRSQVEKKLADSYQSNRSAASYQEEVEQVFGKGNVVVDGKREMIIAYKNSSCKG